MMNIHNAVSEDELSEAIITRFATEKPEWVAQEVILRVMYYRLPIEVDGLHHYFDFERLLAVQFYHLYEDVLKTDFDAQKIFIEGIYLAFIR